VLGSIIVISGITVWYYLYSKIPTLQAAQATDQQGLFFLLYSMILLFLAGGALSWLSSRVIGESLRDLRQRNQELATAYQQQTDQVQREHELGMRIGELAGALATVSTHQVYGVTTQASSVSQAVSALMELHNAADQIASTAEEVRQATAAVLQSVGHAQALVTTSRVAVQRNRAQVQGVIERMTALEQLTARLTGFTNDIRDLSEETHLLALNATIEAAGAGVMGRRFGVVANEVQNLSHRANEVVDQIRMLIGELRQAGQITLEATQGSVNVAHEVEALTDEVRTVQNQVTAAVQRASELAQFISAATSQQTAATAQVTQSMQELQAVAASHRDDTTALDRAIGELNQTASQLTVTFGTSNGHGH
jgi:methyl-accepting chemotaxis protein